MPSLLSPARLLGRRAVPWLIVLDVLRQTRAHWKDQLDEGERRRLTDLLRKSHGRPGNLTAAERDEVRRIADHLDVLALGARVARSSVGMSRGGGRG